MCQPPWRKDVDPRDIPHDRCETKLQALAETISIEPDLPNRIRPLRVTACHDLDDSQCPGWGANQASPGNDTALRLMLLSCEIVDRIRLVGEQHESFEATMP